MKLSIVTSFLIAVLAGTCLLAPGCVRAQDNLLPQLKPAKNGVFTLEGIQFQVQHKSWVWAPAWQRDLAVAAGYPKSEADSQTVQGIYKTDSGPYDFVQQLKQIPDGISYHASVSGTPTKDSRFLCLSLLLPVEDYRSQKIVFGDKPVEVPWWFKGQGLLASTPVKSIRVPLKSGNTLAIKGDFNAAFLDNREYAGGSLDLQVYFTPHSGTIDKAALDVTLEVLPPGMPLSLTYIVDAQKPPRVKRGPATPQTFTADPSRIAASVARVKSLPALHPQGEQFVGPDGKPVRFWGMNLVAFYPDYDLADKTAENLASLGVNLVRPHHNLRPSTDWEPRDVSALMTYEADSRTPNLKAWDRYDYLNARLREKGIYVSLSIHGTRNYVPEDGAILKVSPKDDEAWAEAMDDLNHWGWQKAFDPRKMLPVFDERAFLLNAEYARTMLNHVNPYTGLAYGKDPQVLTIELINEFSSEYTLVCGNKFPDYWAQKLDALLAEYIKGKGAAPFTIYGKKTPEQAKLFSQFCNELDVNYAKRLEKVIRETGYQGPIAFSNLWRGDAQLRWRAASDGFIEDHAYDDPLVTADTNKFLYGISKSAVAGKPVIIGEFNQSENAKLITDRKPVLSMLPVAAAAYGSLQNYSGITWFAWAHGIFELNPDGWGKPGKSNPIGTIAGNEVLLDHMRACGLIFKNDYLSASTEPQTVYVDSGYTPTNYNEIMNGQSVVQPGWQAVHSFRKSFEQVPAAQANAPWLKEAPPAHTLADTGEIVRDGARQQLSFASPYTEGFSGMLDGKAAEKLSVLRVGGDKGFATVVAVTLDGKPLRESRHILLSRTCDGALPVALNGVLSGTWSLKSTRPVMQSVSVSAKDGSIVLPDGGWRECEISLE